MQKLFHKGLSVADPDLQIRGGGGVGSLKKKHFLVLWASVWSTNVYKRLQIRGDGTPGPSPGSATGDNDEKGQDDLHV